VAIVDPWDFPSEQSFRTRTRYDYKPKTLSAGARNLTAALCGRNNQMAKEHMADPTILSTHRAKNRSTKECGWKHGNRGGRGSKGKNPKKERKKERKKIKTSGLLLEGVVVATQRLPDTPRSLDRDGHLSLTG
jgi:hypothetical protein